MVNFTFGDYQSLTDEYECQPVTSHDLVTWTSSGNASMSPGAITVESGTADRAYLIQAAEWGAEAGEQWTRDIQCQWPSSNRWNLGTTAHACCGTAAEGSSNWHFMPRRELTPEQAEESARHQREREYRRDRAIWRAEELLLRNLTPGQRASYLEHGRFTVKTKRRHRYAIGKARSQNVVRINKRGKPMRVYCLTVGHGVPLPDALLGQKLMLDHDEDHFLAVARQWPVRFALGVNGLVRRPIGRVTISNGDESL